MTKLDRFMVSFVSANLAFSAGNIIITILNLLSIGRWNNPFFVWWLSIPFGWLIFGSFILTYPLTFYLVWRYTK